MGKLAFAIPITTGPLGDLITDEQRQATITVFAELIENHPGLRMMLSWRSGTLAIVFIDQLAGPELTAVIHHAEKHGLTVGACHERADVCAIAFAMPSEEQLAEQEQRIKDTIREQVLGEPVLH